MRSIRTRPLKGRVLHGKDRLWTGLFSLDEWFATADRTGRCPEHVGVIPVERGIMIETQPFGHVRGTCPFAEKIPRDHTFLRPYIGHDRGVEFAGEDLVYRRFGHVKRVRDVVDGMDLGEMGVDVSHDASQILIDVIRLLDEIMRTDQIGVDDVHGTDTDAYPHILVHISHVFVHQPEFPRQRRVFDEIDRFGLLQLALDVGVDRKR